MKPPCVGVGEPSASAAGRPRRILAPSAFLVKLNRECPMTGSVDASRRDQMFPVLSAAEIARIRRFGTPMEFKHGECLYVAGECSPGLFLVLKGGIVATMRDGMG